METVVPRCYLAAVLLLLTDAWPIDRATPGYSASASSGMLSINNYSILYEAYLFSNDTYHHIIRAMSIKKNTG